MTWDIFIAIAFVFSIFITWFQRKTIFELEKDIWEIEQAYKEVTGKLYQYKHRQFELWGNNGGKQKKEQI